MDKTKKGQNVEVRSSSKASGKGKDKDEVHYHYHMGHGTPGGYYRQGGAAPGAQPQQPPGVHYHYYYEPPKKVKRKSSKPTIAGALMIIHAIASIILAILLVTTGMFFGDLGEGIVPFEEDSKGDLHGYVTYTNQTPAEGVIVSVVGESGITTTDGNGYYIIYNIPSGNQEIKVEKSGYNTIKYKTFISPSDLNIVSRRNGDVDPEDYEEKDHSGNWINFTLTPGSETLERGEYPPFEWIRNVFVGCAVVIILLSIISIVGAIYSIKRQRYGFAILGSVVGVITGGLLPIIALFILLISREEFKKSEKDT